MYTIGLIGILGAFVASTSAQSNPIYHISSLNGPKRHRKQQ